MRLAVELGVSNDVHFFGRVADVARHLDSIDLYVHAARSEPFGLALVEAMSCGLPVITLDGEGNRDVMTDAVGTLLHADAPVAAFAGEVREWCRPKRYREGSMAAQAHAAQFGISGYVDQLLAIYEQAI